MNTGPGAEDEALVARIPDVRAGDVDRQEVGRELDARELQSIAAAIALHSCVLPMPGTSTSSTWPRAAIAHEHALDDVALADDHLLDRVAHGRELRADALDAIAQRRRLRPARARRRLGAARVAAAIGPVRRAAVSGRRHVRRQLADDPAHDRPAARHSPPRSPRPLLAAARRAPTAARTTAPDAPGSADPPRSAASAPARPRAPPPAPAAPATPASPAPDRARSPAAATAARARRSRARPPRRSAARARTTARRAPAARRARQWPAPASAPSKVVEGKGCGRFGAEQLVVAVHAAYYAAWARQPALLLQAETSCRCRRSAPGTDTATTGVEPNTVS